MNKRIRFSGRSKLVTMAIVTALAVVVAGVALAADTPYLFDHFETQTQSIIASVGVPQVTSTAGDTDPNILGGERDLVAALTNGIGQIELQADAGLYPTELAFIAAPSSLGYAVVKWDGNNNDPLVLNPTGLGGLDITKGGVLNGFNMYVTSDDVRGSVTITIYTSSTAYSRYTLNLPGGINAANPTAFFVPFANFTDVGGGADETNVGAVVMSINATTLLSSGLDLVVHLTESNGRDFGDLPVGYPITTLANNGARHILGPLYLGTEIDTTNDGNPSTDALGDDQNGTVPADEDGVTRTSTPWSNGPGNGEVTAVVVGGPGCLSGWIDWNNNNSFADSGDQVINMVPVTTGSNPLPIDVPANTFPGPGGNLLFNARFRLAPDILEDGDCTLIETPLALTGEVYNGEVEDYQWGFGPTAVTLNNLEAKADAQNNTAVLILAASVVAALGLAGVVMARRRTA